MLGGDLRTGGVESEDEGRCWSCWEEATLGEGECDVVVGGMLIDAGGDGRRWRSVLSIESRLLS